MDSQTVSSRIPGFSRLVMRVSLCRLRASPALASRLSLIVFAAALAVIYPAGVRSDSASYCYDHLGRLAGVVDSSGNSAKYSYDPVGNLTSITRTAPPTASVCSFTPSSGPSNTAVTIYGANFSTTPSHNAVLFNDVPAVVVSSTATTIETSVPPAASRGVIKVIVLDVNPNPIATSDDVFDVTAN